MAVAWAAGDVALFVCARCQRELPYSESYADPDKGPSLRVCWRDRDQLDPWKLPARQMEALAMQYPRPDVILSAPLEGIIWDGVNYWDSGQFWDAETIGQNNPLSD